LKQRVCVNVAQRVADLGLVDDLLQLLGAQHRHGAHRDAARLDDAEPARRQHGVVGRAQQHAVAGYQAHVIDQHVGDAVGFLRQRGVAPAQAGGLNAHALAAALCDRLVQQLGRAVQLGRELQFWQLEQVVGLQLRGRQMLARKSIEVAGSSKSRGHRDAPLAEFQEARFFSNSRAMMSCCTSVAPS
jgi:hypothetical protein